MSWDTYVSLVVYSMYHRWCLYGKLNVRLKVCVMYESIELIPAAVEAQGDFKSHKDDYNFKSGIPSDLR